MERTSDELLDQLKAAGSARLDDLSYQLAVAVAATPGSFMSFGDGSHRCPGSQVAIAETRVFLDRLMRLPGLKLARTPQMTWCDGLMSYELRDAIVTCGPGD